MVSQQLTRVKLAHTLVALQCHGYMIGLVVGYESFVAGKGSSANVAFCLHILCSLGPRLGGTYTGLITVELHALIIAVELYALIIAVELYRLIVAVHTLFTAAAASVSTQRLGYLTSLHWIHYECPLVRVVDSVDILQSVVRSTVFASAVDSGLVGVLDSAVGSGLVCVVDSVVASGLVTCVSIPAKTAL